jgi:hypothetical protein
VVLIIDEAGMANTRVSARVIERAVLAEAKVIAAATRASFPPSRPAGGSGR